MAFCKKGQEHLLDFMFHHCVTSFLNRISRHFCALSTQQMSVIAVFAKNGLKQERFYLPDCSMPVLPDYF